jgi:TolB protein
MSRWRSIQRGLYIAALILLTAVPVHAGYDYIDISNPFLRKIPIATPYFRPTSEAPEEVKIAEEASEILSKAIDFTGYFKIIDREAYLENPREGGIMASNITFSNWTAVGAELLITGGVLISDGLLQMELRLFDTFKEKLLIGKRYKGKIEDRRRMIHRFCGEVIHLLTGNWGVFDSRIAFVSSGTGNKEIFICDFDGTSPEQWTNSGTITLSPAWSSDGKWIAYTSYARGNPDLYIRHVKEKRGTVVAKEGINSSPAWVPGQFSLAATLSFSGNPEIYLLTGNGKIIKSITNRWGIDESPTWSPDGNRIAFVSNRSGTPQIYIKTLDSGRVERLTFEGRYNTQPCWSPKGDKIAYTAMQDGEINIRVIGIDGNGLMQLTQNAVDNESPSWSPDGTLIAFSSNREGRYRIYVMTGFGTDQRRLLTLPGDQTNPAWSPRLINN